MHDNTLLFNRCGLNPSALRLLAAHIEGKEPSIRATQLWYAGERTPKNGLVEIAERLDRLINNNAIEVIQNAQTKEKILVTKFEDDEKLWSAHPEMKSLNNSVHSALINRIIVFGMARGLNVSTLNNKSDGGWIVDVFIDARDLCLHKILLPKAL